MAKKQIEKTIEKRIFISYRRSDTSGHAGRLYDYLSSYFGSDRIFFDVDIEPGTDFEQKIINELDNTDVVLVLIGNQWLNVAGKNGIRRLDDPHDYVRFEVQTALNKKIQVIPILLQGVSMPAEDMLPGEMCDLSKRNAIRLNDDHWKSDCRLVTTLLKNTISVSRSLNEQKIRKYTIIAFIMAALLTVSAVIYGLVSRNAIEAPVALFLYAILLIGAAVNVALVTYLLGNIKKELDRLSWIIIGIATMAVILVGWRDLGMLSRAVGFDDPLSKIWVGVIMFFEAGLLNFVKPDD